MTEERPRLDLAFARRADRTVLERRVFRWPFTLTRTFALDQTPAHMLTAIVQSSSGAVHGGDSLRQRIRVSEGAAGHVTTQGATSIHRADGGAASSEAISIRVENDGYLEYLPEPRILFPDAALEQTTEIDCAVGGVALVGDAFTIHDPQSRGRSFRRLTSTTVFRVGEDEPAMVDRIDIADIDSALAAGFRAFATLILAAPGDLRADAHFADALTATLSAIPGLYAAASPLPGNASGIGVRLAGRDLRATRAGAASTWAAVRQRFHGAPPPSRRKGDG